MDGGCAIRTFSYVILIYQQRADSVILTTHRTAWSVSNASSFSIPPADENQARTQGEDVVRFRQLSAP